MKLNFKLSIFLLKEWHFFFKKVRNVHKFSCYEENKRILPSSICDLYTLIEVEPTMR
jgi:hypothetical protein